MNRSYPLFSMAAALALLTSPGMAQQIIISEIMPEPVTGKPEWIEVRNLSRTPYDMALWALSGGVDLVLPAFNATNPSATILSPLERLIISSGTEAEMRLAYPGIPPGTRIFGPWTGQLSNSGERITLRDKNNGLVNSVSFSQGGRWPDGTARTGHSLVVVNENRDTDDAVNWRRSHLIGGTPGRLDSPVDSELIPGQSMMPNPELPVTGSEVVADFSDTWSFYKETAAPPANWNLAAFTPAAPWGSGNGLFGFETGPLPAPGLVTNVQTTDQISYYFRRNFTWSAGTTGTFEIDQILDDGVIYYLNGQELGRTRINAGAVTHNTTPANFPVTDAVLEPNAIIGNLPAGALVNGPNVLSALVLQQNAGSSDLVFGARMRILPPGPSRTVVINEVKPSTTAGQGFVEFYNTTAAPIDLAGWQISDDTANLAKFTIAGPLVVAPSGFAIIDYAGSGLTLPATGNITLLLTMPGAVVAHFKIALAPLTGGKASGMLPSGTANWFTFITPTPGAQNGTGGVSSGTLIASLAAVEPLTKLVVNEVTFTGDPLLNQLQATAIEFYNPTSAAIPLAGLFVSNTADLSGKVTLSGSVAPRGWTTVTPALPVLAGAKVNLHISDAAGNIVAASAVPYAAGFTMPQVYPDGSREWYRSAAGTLGAANAPARETRIVINEISYDPPSGHVEGEFVELFNRGPGTVDLSGWKLRGEVDYDFPAGSGLAAGAYLVIAGEPTRLRAITGLAAGAVAGPWGGKLSNRGGLLRLSDAASQLADEVRYENGHEWDVLAGTQGSTLELTNPAQDNTRGSAWRASDESAKGAWKAFSFTAPWKNWRNRGALSESDYKEMQMWLSGDGEVVVRNLAVRKDNTGPNLLVNPGTVATGTVSSAGWMMRGTHGSSYVDAIGVHLVSTGHGKLLDNACEIDLSPLIAEDVITMSGEARWVRGRGRLIVQTFDQTVGGIVSVPMPEVPGTPGAVNGRFQAVAPPTVDSVMHSPAVPLPTQPVLITARISSITPLTKAVVRHRADDVNTNPALATNWTETALKDDGTGGDITAGDGLYSATLTTYTTENRLVQFTVRAEAGAANGFTWPTNPEAPCLFVKETQSSLDAGLRGQRLLMSEYWYDYGVTDGSGIGTSKYKYVNARMSNAYLPGVFIHDDKEVYYGAEIRKTGSVFTRSVGRDLYRGTWKLPEALRFRGRVHRAFENQGGTNSDRVVRYWLYLNGEPAEDGEFIGSYINGTRLGVIDDIEPVGNDFLDRTIENGSDGWLYGCEDAWWARDGNNRDVPENEPAHWLYTKVNGTQYDGRGKEKDDPIIWHNEFMLRTREQEYDYGGLASAVKTITGIRTNPVTSTEADLTAVVDFDSMAAYTAARGYSSDNDTFTYIRGKNCFQYRKPSDGKLRFLHWDSDAAFGNPTDLFIINLGDDRGRNVKNVTDRPQFQRQYTYWLNRMITEYTSDGTNLHPRFDAWISAMNSEEATPGFDMNRARYLTFCNARRASTLTAIGSGRTIPFALTAPPATSTAASIDLAGVAPITAWSVVLDNHPEAFIRFTSSTAFSVSGISLKQGANLLTFRMLDRDGVSVGTLTHTVTKTGGTAPRILTESRPGSWRVTLGEPIEIDATASFDPEAAGPLQYAWSVAPALGVRSRAVSAGVQEYRFTGPGIYTVTLIATDAAGQTTTVTREVAAHARRDFQNFEDPILSPLLAPQAAAVRAGDYGQAWYSTQDEPGRLLLQLPESQAAPLSTAGTDFPAVLRALPAGDWVLQTSFRHGNRLFGDFATGLVLNLPDGRYAFALDQGKNIVVRRYDSAALPTTIATSPYILTALQPVPTLVLRIRKVGALLSFQRSAGDGNWTTIGTATLTAAQTVPTGGLFIATGAIAVQGARTSFDSLMVVDPTQVSPYVLGLRLTELMYHPAGSDVEFIELQNRGPVPLDLSGVAFDNTQPFTHPGFPPGTMLAPGEYIVLTPVGAVLPGSPRIGPSWTAGSLNNGGEKITLRDPDGNPLHDFTYSDKAPWPVTPDGQGPSLEVIDPDGDYTDPANWRASVFSGGSPGRAPTLLDVSDSDGDGMAAWAEAAFGTDPADPRSVARVSLSHTAGNFTLTWPAAPGRSFRVESSEHLTRWDTVVTITGNSYAFPSGPGRLFFRIAPMP
jgi:Lamin Tail Domain/CotH kinase protein